MRRRDKERQGKTREDSTKARDRPAEAQACCVQSRAFLLQCDFLTELLGILEGKIVLPDIKQEKQPGD